MWHRHKCDGKNVFVVICDELHVWEGERGNVVWGTLTRGTVARREPMVIQITTAGYDKQSVCYELYNYAKRVQSGEVVHANTPVSRRPRSSTASM